MGLAPDADDDGLRLDPWATADDDGVLIDIDAARAATLIERLERGAAPLSLQLAVEVTDDNGPRPLDRAEVEFMISEASEVCLGVIRRSPVKLDEEGFEGFARAASLLSTIWALGFQADEPAGEKRRAELGWLDLIGKLAADCEDMLYTRIHPQVDGAFALKWGFRDRAAVRRSMTTLRTLMSSDDPAVSRLFPSAYGPDAERNAGWDALMRGELIDRRLEALKVVEQLTTKRHCNIEELDAFMRCLNDARLVLGTRLDVSEDDDRLERLREAAADPAVWRDRVAYERLTNLLGVTIEALGSTL